MAYPRESEKKWDEEQRRLYLEKKKKSIERELSLGADEKEVMLQGFTAKLEGKIVPEYATNVINEELVCISLFVSIFLTCVGLG